MPKQHYRVDTFKLQDSIGYLVKHTQRALQERIEELFAQHKVGEQNFTLQQWVVMMHIRDKLALTTGSLCKKLQHDSGAMTRLIDQLENRGLIGRERTTEDRRKVHLSLTPAGHEVLDKLIPVAVDALNLALDGFTKEEVKLLQSMLRRLTERVRELTPDSAEEVS